jgi:acetyltransferase-like isoleucine patch superfamily enzyme
MLDVKKVKIGSHVFIGAGSHLASVVVIDDGTFLPAVTNFYPNQQVQ